MAEDLKMFDRRQLGRRESMEHGSTCSTRRPGRSLATVSRCPTGGHGSGRCPRAPLFDEGSWWPRTSERDRGRILLRAAEIMRRELDRLAELETVDCGKPLAEAKDDPRRGRVHVRVLRGLGDQDRRVHPTGGPRRDVARGEGADGGRCRDHPLELSDADGRAEGCSRDRCRDVCSSSSRPSRPADGPRDPQDPRGGRSSARRAQRDHRVRRDRRCAARHGSPRRQGRIHRLPRRRQDHHAFRRGHPEACDPRARRQVPEHRIRGRRFRSRRSRGRPTGSSGTKARSAPRAHACSSRRRSTTTRSRRSSRRANAVKVGDGADPDTTMGPLVSQGAAGTRRALHRHRSEGGEARRAGRPSPARPGSPAAISSRRRSSPTWTTRRRSRRRRSSARSSP